MKFNGCFDGMLLDEKRGFFFFLSSKTKNTVTAKICSESTKEYNKSREFHQGRRGQTSCSQKMQRKGEEKKR